MELGASFGSVPARPGLRSPQVPVGGGVVAVQLQEERGWCYFRDSAEMCANTASIIRCTSGE